MSHKSNPTIVRTALEVEAAHDLLVSILTDCAPIAERLFEEPEAARFLYDCDAFSDVLCWLLGHDNPGVEDFLEHAREVAEIFRKAEPPRCREQEAEVVS